MPDREVLFDVVKLTFSFLDRDQNGFSSPERARVETFIRLFMPLFYGISHAEMEAQLGAPEASEADEDEEESELDTAAASDAVATGAESSAAESSTTPAAGANGHGKKTASAVNKKGGAADLRKRLLKHAANAARGGQSRSRANSPTGDESPDTGAGVLLGEQAWIQLGVAGDKATTSLDEPLPTRRFNFFANSTFYCLIRLIHVSVVAEGRRHPLADASLVALRRCITDCRRSKRL